MALTSPSHAFIYDVFLSFRGPDTRLGFTGNLYKALDDRGIHTFFDDEELRSGEEITPALLKAIEESRIAIVVLSDSYAHSSFCLEELAYILECRKRIGLLVLPVFYNLNPSQVRHQNGSYREALAKHEGRLQLNMEKFQKWKKALCEVAELSGFPFKDGDEYEYKCIERIVEQVSEEINRAPLRVADYPVGLESQVREVRKLLDDGSNDGVHMIGIHGMGGVGKSTLARAVYNDLISEKFDGLCFLENVREESNRNGLKHLLSILFSKILGDKEIKLASTQEVIQHRLRVKKVLLILDDVDKREQLRTLAGGLDWFGPGSRVIITTRDKQLLASHDVKRTYEVKVLNENDALQLLTWKAFKKEKADPSYKVVLHRAVTYASGLPLALEVIGSYLFEKSIEKWESAIEQYERIPRDDILEVLKVSFDALQHEEKNVFLDIACCLKGMTGVEDILRAHYGHSVKYHIDVLVEKSLVKVGYFRDGVTMHDLIEDMGKEIVRRESRDEPRKRSRLWLREDIIQVLEENSGTNKTKIIRLDFPVCSKEIVKWDGKAFKKMQKLKTLIINNGKFSKGPKYLPKNLRVLEWRGCPSHYLPPDFRSNQLAICKLPCSSIKSFELDGLLKKFLSLTVLNLDECKSLTHIPDVSGFSNLEELSFKFCDKLVGVHESIGSLPKLKTLNAFACSNLASFPRLELTSLEELELSCCRSLENFPEISGKMENIRKLDLEYTPTKGLPISFQNLVGLQSLIVRELGFGQLPSSIFMMPQLTFFRAIECKGWQWTQQQEGEENVGSIVSLSVPWSNLDDSFFSIGFTRFAHVRELDLRGNNFTFLPDCIKELQFLWELNVSYCERLQQIEGVPPSLGAFNAINCTSLTSSSTSVLINQELYEGGLIHCCLPGPCIPEWFDHQSSGPSSSFWFRNKVPAGGLLCVLIAPVTIEIGDVLNPMVFINDKVHASGYGTDEITLVEMDHTYLTYVSLWGFSPLENEWNHVKITYEGVIDDPSIVKASGIHVFKQESSNEGGIHPWKPKISKEDIRFDDPLDDDLNSPQSSNCQLLKKRKFVDMEAS